MTRRSPGNKKKSCKDFPGSHLVRNLRRTPGCRMLSGPPWSRPSRQVRRALGLLSPWESLSLTHSRGNHSPEQKWTRALVSEFTTSPAIGRTGRWRLCSWGWCCYLTTTLFQWSLEVVVLSEVIFFTVFFGRLDKISRRWVCKYSRRKRTIWMIAMTYFFPRRGAWVIKILSYVCGVAILLSD